MDKKENHSHHHHHNNTDSFANLIIVFALNIFFSIFEIIGGFYANSLAIVSDAIHDLGDALVIGLSLIFEKVAQKKSDKSYSYGYGRYSLASAFISSLVLVAGSIGICFHSIPRLWHPQKTEPDIMLAMAIFGVLVNGLSVWRLLRAKKANHRAIMLHMLEDTLGWIGVLIGSIFIYFLHWYWIDPLLSIFISIYIVYHAFSNLHEFTKIFLQAIPADIEPAAILQDLQQLIFIDRVEKLHIWSLDGSFHIGSCHIFLHADCSLELYSYYQQQIDQIFAQYPIQHKTIELRWSK